mmetsp:Transcript_15906/g.27066  ORF Transcript_15906/g.27066 Transcript_15906/m.27066 type:complete len:374 (+) Transcript_15906:245-1366(+)
MLRGYCFRFSTSTSSLCIEGAREHSLKNNHHSDGIHSLRQTYADESIGAPATARTALCLTSLLLLLCRRQSDLGKVRVNCAACTYLFCRNRISTTAFIGSFAALFAAASCCCCCRCCLPVVAIATNNFFAVLATVVEAAALVFVAVVVFAGLTALAPRHFRGLNYSHEAKAVLAGCLLLRGCLGAPSPPLFSLARRRRRRHTRSVLVFDFSESGFQHWPHGKNAPTQHMLLHHPPLLIVILLLVLLLLVLVVVVVFPLPECFGTTLPRAVSAFPLSTAVIATIAAIAVSIVAFPPSLPLAVVTILAVVILVVVLLSAGHSLFVASFERVVPVLERLEPHQMLPRLRTHHPHHATAAPPPTAAAANAAAIAPTA